MFGALHLFTTLGGLQMNSKLKLIESENEIFKIMRDGTGFVGIVYHPETGQEVQKFYSASEQGIRTQLIKFIYSTIPMVYRNN